MAQWLQAGKVSDFKEGEGKVVNLQGKYVAVFKVDGNIHAVDNTCPHQGGPLGEGMLDGQVVTCPWHGWRFNVTTGVSPVVPTAKVQKFNVKVDGDKVLIEV